MAGNTALLVLLLAGSWLGPISVHGQTSNLDQPVEASPLSESIAVEPAVTSTVSKSLSATEKGWVFGIGEASVFYHSGGTIAASGQTIPGATANVSNNYTLMFDVRRYITKELSLSLMAGVPPIPTITGVGSVASLGELGRVRYGPAILTADYHLPKLRAFRPYVGAGTAYAIIFKDHDAAVSNLGVHNNWGFVLEGGAEHQLTGNLAVFADVKEVWLAVDAHGAVNGIGPVTAHVNLNPTVVSVGLRFHIQRRH